MKLSIGLVLLLSIVTCSPDRVLAFEHHLTPAPIKISATIGEPKLTLFGYTGADCLVYLQGQRVFEEINANSSGYFEFTKIFLPLPNPGYPELCLTSIDNQQRITFPTCLPPLPTGPYHIEIGPVLLPPTLTLSQGTFAPNQQVIASGQAIPNSTVNIYLSNQKSRLSLIKPALAYNLPHYQANANKDGSFEFNLPVNYSKWRVFAASEFEENPSPKSNTLTFKVLTPLGWLFHLLKQTILFLFNLLSPYLWLLVILLELVAIYLLLKKRKSSLPPGR